MNRRKRIIGSVLVLVALPLGLLLWRVARQYRQECLDQSLIAAIKAQDRSGALLKQYGATQ